MWRGNFWWAIALHLFKTQTWARKKNFFFKMYLPNANVYSLFHLWEHTSTWQPGRQRWRAEPHLKSPGNSSRLANSHMCRSSPPTLHISHIPQECLLLFFSKPGQENGSEAELCFSHAFVCTRWSSSGLFSSCAVCAAFYFFFFLNAVQLKHLLFPASIYVFVGLP